VHVGTVAAGRIGLAVLRRLKPFDMHLHYTDRHRLPEAVEKELGPAWHLNVEDMVVTAGHRRIILSKPIRENQNRTSAKLSKRAPRVLFSIRSPLKLRRRCVY
jgi:lactate dehydrogenase-like 2-hydroxyacid dehydrogenase